MIAITGATGHLGRLVVEALLQKLPASQIIAAVRSPEKAADMASRGVQVRRADYDLPATLKEAFIGVEKLLLISASEIGRRAPQHRAVIDAARQAGVRLVAYTSVLRADSSPLGLAAEHKETEKYIEASGLSFVFLRNSWYTENYTGGLAAALETGVIMGSAGNGRIASAERADYAAAAAAVLTGQDQAGRIYELAGDTAYTMSDLAAEVARQANKPVTYRDMPQTDYQTALVGAGMPEPIAELLADSSAAAANGALFDDGHQLSRLIGRPTAPLAASVATALKG